MSIDNSNLHLVGLPPSSLRGLDSIAVEMPPSDPAPISETIGVRKRKKSICETATEVLTRPLFNALARRRKKVVARNKSSDVKERPKKQKTRAEVVSYLFSWTPQAKRDRALVIFFKKLPNDLQAEVSLAGSESMQARTIRNWLAGIQDGRLSRIETLDLSRSGLEMIPEEIRYLTHLKELNICENAIRDLAPVCHLPRLERLLASSNEISQIPPLTALSRLTYLSIHSNRIRPTEGMLERIPEKAREAFILGVQNQNLRGKVTIPDSWRTARYDALPDVLVQKTGEFLHPHEFRSISKAWDQASYSILLKQYKASPLLQRFIDPTTLQDPEDAVRQVEREVYGLMMRLVLQFQLKHTFTLDPRGLEQAIRDRSLILMFREYRQESGGLGGSSITEEAHRIRSWMENHRAELARCDFLYLPGQNLYVIPEEIKYFTGLRELYLGQNQIQQLNPLRPLVNLLRLYLPGNQIQ